MYRKIEMVMRFVAQTGGDGKFSPLVGCAAEELCAGEQWTGKKIIAVRVGHDDILIECDAELLSYKLDLY